jgi:hypothetical protein
VCCNAATIQLANYHISNTTTPMFKYVYRLDLKSPTLWQLCTTVNNIYTVLWTWFLLQKISHIRSTKFTWCNKFFTHLICICIKTLNIFHSFNMFPTYQEQINALSFCRSISMFVSSKHKRWRYASLCSSMKTEVDNEVKVWASCYLYPQNSFYNVYEHTMQCGYIKNLGYVVAVCWGTALQPGRLRVWFLIGSTQPLTKISTSNISREEGRQLVCKADNPTTFMCQLSRNSGSLNLLQS